MTAPRHFGAVVGLILFVGGGFILPGCGSDDLPSADHGATHDPATRPPGNQSNPSTTNELRCISRMPGEILSEAEAVVRFSTSKACPGYVTVRPGTKVTFHNEDTSAHRITINPTNATGDQLPEVANGIADPGAAWVLTFDDLGMFSYTLDAIPTFRGTVEVTEGDSMHG